MFKGTSGDGQINLFGNLVRSYTEETSASIIIISQSQNQLADINSFAALNGQDSDQGGEPTETLDPSTVQENSFQASSPADTDYLNGFQSDQVVEYTVQDGDSIGIIASDFGLHVDTVVWANNLRNPNALSLGQVLKIPPVDGVIITVQPGDTIASLAKKYKADSQKISSFNKLRDGQALVVGGELMLPEGQLPGPKPSVSAVAKRGSGGSGIYVPTGNGQCVDFVQAHGHANHSGNAYTWKKYINTPAPVVGGVVVLRGGRYGHVALITAVKLNSFQVVEQNFYGPYIIDHREISLTDRAIVGFIQ